MEIEVISKKENPVMGRLEVNFKISHPKEITPRRKDVRDEIATLLKVKKDRIVIDHMNSEFGKPETLGYAKVYGSKEDALQMEEEHILMRNALVEEKKEKAEKKQEAKKETKPEVKAEDEKEGA